MEIKEIDATKNAFDGYYLDKSSGLWGIVKLENEDKLYLKSFKNDTPEWTKDETYAVRFKKDEAKDIMKKLSGTKEESLSEDVNDEFFDSLEVVEVYNDVPIKKLKSGTFCIKSPANGTIRLSNDIDLVKNYIDNYKSIESAADTMADDVPGDITQDYRYGWHNMKEDLEEEEQNEEINPITGISALFMDLINQEYSLLSQYESAQVTLNDLGENRFDEIIGYIKDDINIHIGMLQASIEELNPSAEKVDDGKEEADKLILDESLFE